MLRAILIILAVSACFACSSNKLEQRAETPTETTIQAIVVEPIYIDTIPIIENPTPYINKDSLDRVELIKDSINFRKIVKIINGGYNGFAERYRLWLRARQILSYRDTL